MPKYPFIVLSTTLNHAFVLGYTKAVVPICPTITHTLAYLACDVFRFKLYIFKL